MRVLRLITLAPWRFWAMHPVVSQLVSTAALTPSFFSSQLVQQPAQPPANGLPNGTSFYFRVNGVDIFVKGANLIPSHVFAPEESEKRWRWLLERAVDANMNMVRVWGGGRYQPDYFYDLCDELGLMVWQEMMFACERPKIQPPSCALPQCESCRRIVPSR